MSENETLLPRIIGTECEYNLQHSSDRSAQLYVAQLAVESAGFARCGAYMGSAGGSGKLGVDQGHVEFSTGEALGPASAACEDLGGIDIVGRVVTASGLPHSGLYRFAGTYIPGGKKMTNMYSTVSGATSGYHESYLVERAVTEDPLFDAVVPGSLASRLWAMSGTLRDEGFVFSQKIWGCGDPPVVRSLDRRVIHGRKPMITVPSSASDQDVLGNPHVARAEVRMMDPGQSLVVRYLSLAATSLTLRLLEHKHLMGGSTRLGQYALRQPAEAAKLFAGDLTLSAAAQTVSGTTIRAVNLQEQYISWFAELAEKVQLPADESEAIPLLQETNDALAGSKPADCEYTPLALARLDCAKHHAFVSKDLPQQEVRADNKLAMARNLLWDRVLPNGPGYMYWRSIAERDPAAHRVREHYAAFGLAGRARRRAAYIDNLQPSSASWSSVTANGRVYDMPDAYQM